MTRTIWSCLPPDTMTMSEVHYFDAYQHWFWREADTGGRSDNRMWKCERRYALGSCIGTFQNTGQGWWNEGDIAETIRTPVGGMP